MKGHASILIADYILSQSSKPLNSKELIKLVYISHGRCLAVSGKPLIRDRIDAWKHGPMIQLLFHELAVYNGIIDELIYGEIPLSDEGAIVDRIEFLNTIISKQERNIIKNAITDYKNWTDDELYKLVVEPDSPWDKTFDKSQNKEIKDDVIMRYYKSELIV